MKNEATGAPAAPTAPTADTAPTAGDDARWMGLALQQARRAAERDEVPVGAVVVKDGVQIAAAHNSPIADHDPSAHAEVNALRAAAAALGNYRLEGCTLYVTLEPCAMCAGAILQARLARLVYGAPDPRAGAAGSQLDLFAQPALNPHTRCQGGVAAEASAALLRDFFQARRQAARQDAQPLRDDALRTPPARFAEWAADWPEPQALSDLPSLDGLRLSYVDTGGAPARADATGPHGAGQGAGAPTVLCLHGWDQWGLLFRHLLPRLDGLRVLVPDLPGFGRSDKPKREAAHRLDWQARLLREWLARVGAGPLWIVHHPDTAALAQALAATDLGAAFPPVQGQLALDCSRPAPESIRRAWAAPFPDRGFEAARRALAPRRRRSGPGEDLDAPAAQALAAQLRALIDGAWGDPAGAAGGTGAR